MGGSGGGSGAGSAGGTRQGRPRGAMTGQKSVDSKGNVTRSGPTMATPNRSDLPGRTALDIAMNPLSKQSTLAEKAMALGQMALPGGSLVGLGRAGLMGYSGTPSTGGDTMGGNSNAPAAMPTPVAKSVSAAKKSVQSNKSTTRAKAKTKGTYSSQILTSSLGDLDEANITKKTLLGG